MELRSFEDLDVGETHELGSTTVSGDAVRSFAEQFAPQPYHVDEDGAEGSVFDGIVASGFHTAAIGMRLTIDGFLGDVASVGGRGVDDLRWLTPVRPGDTLAGRGTLAAAEPSTNHAGRGNIDYQVRSRTRTERTSCA